MAVGRITGPLLKANLLRDGVDLAFETDLLYLDVTNGKVGIKRQPDPLYDLDVDGTTRSTNLNVTDEADIASFTISGNTISSTNSTINIEASGTNPVVYQGKIVTGDLQLSTNVIEVTVADEDLQINTAGTGKVVVGTVAHNTEVLVNGNLHATGNITADGDIQIGDVTGQDNVVFNADINSDIIPNTNNSFDLGSDPTTGGQAWKNVYADNIVTNTLELQDLTVNGDFEVTNTSTFNGDVTLGSDNTDTVTFNGKVNSNIIPTADAFYDIGATGSRWANAYLNRIEIDGVVIDNNTIETTLNNDDLTLSANGIGKIAIPDNDVLIDQDLTVNGTTNLTDTDITGTLTQTGLVTVVGDIDQTGDFTTSGTATITGNITATGTLEVGDISVSGNTVEVTTADTDLNLVPNGTGDVVFEDIRVHNNTFQSTQTDENIVIQPNGTGNVVIDNDQSLQIPVGTDAQRPTAPTNGMVRYNTDRSQYEGYNATYSKWLPLSGVQDYDGNTKITAESAPGANENVLSFYADGNLTATIDNDKLFAEKIETTGITIENNNITAINIDADINISTTGSGGVKIGNLKINSNSITNVVPNAVTEFTETGTGYVKIAGANGVVIPSGTNFEQPASPQAGMIRYNTYYQYVEVYDASLGWINSAGTSAGISLLQATDLGIVSALLFG
jgi:hypothetical protein